MNTNASGETETSSGVTEKKELEVEQPIVSDKPERPSYESYQKLLAEKKKLAQENKEKAAIIAAEERRKLEEAGNWQKLLEEERKAREEAAKELAETKEMISDARKMSALNNALSGRLNPKYYGVISLKNIEIDELGNPVQSSVERYAKEVAKTYPEIIVTNNGVKLPQGAAIPTVVETITPEAWASLKGSKAKIEKLPLLLKELKK